MTREQISHIVKQQRRYFKSGVTLPVSMRIEMLKKLRKALADNIMLSCWRSISKNVFDMRFAAYFLL